MVCSMGTRLVCTTCGCGEFTISRCGSYEKYDLIVECTNCDGASCITVTCPRIFIDCVDSRPKVLSIRGV